MTTNPPPSLRARIAAALRVHYHCPGNLDPDGPIPCACGWMDPGPDATHESDFDAHMADVMLGVLAAETPTSPTDEDIRAAIDKAVQGVILPATWQAWLGRTLDAVQAAVLPIAAQLRRERDLAIAHDRQPYPTAWAYEQACAALRRKTEAIERVRAIQPRPMTPDSNALGLAQDNGWNAALYWVGKALDGPLDAAPAVPVEVAADGEQLPVATHSCGQTPHTWDCVTSYEPRSEQPAAANEEPCP